MLLCTCFVNHPRGCCEDPCVITWTAVIRDEERREKVSSPRHQPAVSLWNVALCTGAGALVGVPVLTSFLRSCRTSASSSGAPVALILKDSNSDLLSLF